MGQAAKRGRWWMGTGAVLLVAAAAWSAEGAAPQTLGWRGNWTGLYPEADPPTEWGRTPAGVVAGLTAQAAKPAAGQAKGAELKDGLVRQWLVLGMLPTENSVRDFDKPQVPNEADLSPAEGDKVGELAWQRYEPAYPPDYERWGTTELDWIDLAKPLTYRANSVAYAHAYLHADRPGKATMVVEHAYGMKVWVNGKAVYSAAKNAGALGLYVSISRQKQALVHHGSPKFEIELTAGWNRLLVKVGSYPGKEWRTARFTFRLMDPAPAPYEDRNVLWAAKMTERTNAAPIIVGDRLFTPAEPDELLCVDKNTGKVLWRRINDYYEAAPSDQRSAHAVFREKIEPLEAELRQTTDYVQATELRRKIRKLLEDTDKKAYAMKWDGHLASHFGIVGFTTTPVSDGKHVWAFYGHGVVACYDLEGNRKWIRRLEAEEIRYSCSPAWIGGRLVVIFGGMHGLDAATGKTLWSRPEIPSIATLIPARMAGTDVVVSQKGHVVRVADGKVLWVNPRIIPNDTGWAAPLVLGDVMYLPWSGVSGLIVADFAGQSGDEWKPKVRYLELGAHHRRPNGEWLDRFTPCSPLVRDGIYYEIDQYGVFYALDLATGKPLYKHETGFDELHHYNAIGVAASPALGGKHIYVMDNQGTCVVLAPGRTYKPVAVNRLRTQLARDWAIPPQEILANAPPVFDGKRMYLRGEQYLYCIGKK